MLATGSAVSTAGIGEVLPNSNHMRWRSEDMSEIRNRAAEKNVHYTDCDVRYDSVDEWTSRAVNSHPVHWQNAAGLADPDAWLDVVSNATSTDTQSEFAVYLSLLDVTHSQLFGFCCISAAVVKGICCLGSIAIFVSTNAFWMY